MAANILKELEDEGYFIKRVGDHFRNTDDYGGLLECSIKVDDARLTWAHTEYLQSINEFSLRLTSGDPDHYKRTGALLRALYKIKPIVEVTFEPDLGEFDSLFAPVGFTHNDAEYALSLGRMFDLFANEMHAFSFAYNVCATYEQNPTPVNDEYLHTICAYLKGNDNLSADSLYMIFKSLMLK